jgi:mannosylglycerate hydrolase
MSEMRPTYHIVSHTHWDREWYLSFEEFRAMLVNLVDDLLDLFEKDPEFRCFTLDGQLIVLEDYLRVRPEREELLRRYVGERKLFIGPWYVLADEFLVSGEATIRNLLLGEQLGERFGGSMKVGYLPDTFSHSAMMPAILRGFGIDNVILWRGFGGEAGQEPSEYYWNSPDGSRVLMTHLSKFGYSAGYFKEPHPKRVGEIHRRVKNELDARAQTGQRLWMNGGDHHWPDKALTKAIRIMRDMDPESDYIHSNLEDYTAALKAEADDLQEIGGEFRFGFRQAFAVQGGIYSSRMYIKQANFACQHMLERYVEPLNAMNVAAGNRSQLPLIRQAWKTLLQNHPHDSICATSIDSVHEEMMTRFKRVREIAGAVERFCMDDLLPYSYDDYKDDTYLFVFNLLPYDRSGTVDATIDFYLKDIVVGLNPDVKIDPPQKPVRDFILLDEKGNEIPFEIIRREKAYGITYSKYDYPHQTLVDRFTIRFRAENVPSLGYQGYRIVKKKRKNQHRPSIKTGKSFIENELIRLDVSGRGAVTLTDKRTGNVYKNLNVFEDGGDIGDEYNYCPPDKDRIVYSTASRPNIRIVKNTSDASMELRYRVRLPASSSENRKSRSKQYVLQTVHSVLTVNPFSARVDVKTSVNNLAKNHRFRVTFGSTVVGRQSYADTPFAIVEREHHMYDPKDFPIEVPPSCAPMHRFFVVKNDTAGLTIIGKGLPEYDLLLDTKGTVALTLLRSVGSISYGDLKTRRGGEAAWKNMTPGAQCIGEHTFEYAVYPLDARDQTAWDGVLREVDDYLTPMKSLGRKNPGSVPMRRSWLRTDIAGCILSACKESEDGDDIILRWYNAGGTDAECRIQPEFPVSAVRQVDLAERVMHEIGGGNDTAARIRTDAQSITTIRLSRYHTSTGGKE